jgi:hypothetical protein
VQRYWEYLHGRWGWGYTNNFSRRCNSLHRTYRLVPTTGTSYLRRGRQTKKKKAQPASKPIDTSNNRCFTFIQEDVFDTKTFSRGKTELYSKSEMEKYDRAFQKQLLFNFSERRATKKKQYSVGRASRSQAFNLDENLMRQQIKKQMIPTNRN